MPEIAAQRKRSQPPTQKGHQKPTQQIHAKSFIFLVTSLMLFENEEIAGMIMNAIQRNPSITIHQKKLFAQKAIFEGPKDHLQNKNTPCSAT